MLILSCSWLMFPAGILIAAVAMFFGLGGGILWMPLLLMATDLSPRDAVVCTLLIQFFGQGSATLANSRARMIEWPLVRLLVLIGIPAVFCGVLLSRILHPLWIELILGLTIFLIAYVFLRGDDFFVEGRDRADLAAAAKGRPITFAGGILTGFLGIGVGDWLVPFFNKQCGLTMVRSVATSIVLMMVFSLTALTVHLALGGIIHWNIALPAILGVLLGAQLGSRLLQGVPESSFKELFVLMLVFIATHVTFNAV